ncbi:MAG TPA: sporulation protein, partial [Methylophilus sp.]
KSNVVQQSSQESVRYWVYRPPLATAQATQERAEQLKALGIADFFIVQEPKWRNAISFGVFKDEKLATRLVQELQRKGVREVVKSVRNKGNGHSSLVLEGITPTLLDQLKKNQPDFPGTEIKDAACPVT